MGGDGQGILKTVYQGARIKPGDGELQVGAKGLYHIRPAVMEDIPQIIEVARAAAGWDDYIPHVISSWIKDPRGEVIVAATDGRVVGLARYFFQTPRVIWMQGLRVHPEHRGLRLSDRIARECMRRARERGATRARLATSYRNLPALRHIKRIRFRLITRWRVYSNCRSGAPSTPPEPSIAEASQVEKLWDHLRSSKTFRIAGRMYAQGWVWYDLDREALGKLAAAGGCYYYGPPDTPRAIMIAGPVSEERGEGVFRVKYAEGRVPQLRQLVEYAIHLASQRGLPLTITLPKFRGSGKVVDRAWFEWAGEMLVFGRSL
jgi:GNAT superfamily N-acetyltransferase